VQRYQGSLGAQPPGRGSGLAARVPTPDHDHIKNFVENHHHLPIQKVLNICSRISSAVVSPVISPRNLRALCKPTSTSSSLAPTPSNSTDSSSELWARRNRS